MVGHLDPEEAPKDPAARYQPELGATAMQNVQHPTNGVIADASTVLERFPAGGPRGSWPAEEFADARRAEGLTVEVVMNLATDTFDVKAVNA